MPTVLRTSQAEADLSDIFTYIAEDNLVAAENTLRLIGTKCALLAQTPALGRDRSDLHPRVRSFPVGNYVIFYRPIADGVEVIRVLHAARDVERIFR